MIKWLISQLQVRRLSRATAVSMCTWWHDFLFAHLCCCRCFQLSPGDSQSASRAPVPSCLAGRMPRCSGGWPRGGRRWAGSRRWCQTCRTSGPTWARSQSDGLGSQVSHAWPGCRVNKGQGSSLCRLKLDTQPQKNVQQSVFKGLFRILDNGLIT